MNTIATQALVASLTPAQQRTAQTIVHPRRRTTQEAAFFKSENGRRSNNWKEHSKARKAYGSNTKMLAPDVAPSESIMDMIEQEADYFLSWQV